MTILGESPKSITILMADDDSDDRLLVREALENVDIPHQLDVVTDGEMLMDYLYRRGSYQHLQNAALPSLILLDLKMPKKTGMEALKEIKADPHLRRIPIVILTTSETEGDVYKSYDIGASSYITKSVTLTSLVEAVEEIGRYWLEIVELPPDSIKRS